MFCPNCGTNNEDGALFCENCGQRLTTAEPAKTPVVEEPIVEAPAVEEPAAEVSVPEAPAETEPLGVEASAEEAPAAEIPAEIPPVIPTSAQSAAPQQSVPTEYQVPQYQTPPQYQPTIPVYAVGVRPAGEKSAAIAAMKRVLSSPLFLIGAILYSVAMILSFVADVTFTDKIKISFNGFSFVFGKDIGSAVSSLISFVIVAVGVWLIYCAAIKKDDSCSPAGFIILKVLSIISLVVLCIAAAGVIVLFVALMLLGGNFQLESFIKFGDSPLDAELKTLLDGILSVDKWVWAVVFGAAITLIILAIIYFAKLSGTLTAAKRVAKTGAPTKRISLFVAVGFFVVAAGSLSVSVSMMTIGLIFHGIATIVFAAAYVFFGIVILNLRKVMKEEFAKARKAPAGAPLNAQNPYGAVPGSVCPRCGRALAPDFMLCPQCGLPRQN